MLQRKEREKENYRPVFLLKILNNPKQSMNRLDSVMFSDNLSYPSWVGFKNASSESYSKNLINVIHHINKETNHVVISINAEKSFVQLNNHS